MPQKGERLEVCQRGHNDWAVDDKSGHRSCRTCRQMRNERRTRRRGGVPRSREWADTSRLGDKGPPDDAFTYEDIMKARGYIGK